MSALREEPKEEKFVVKSEKEIMAEMEAMPQNPE
jgi:hypothetical protein